MLDARLDRRQFVGAGLGLGALSLLPAPVFARIVASDWSKVQAALDAYVADDRLPGAAAAVGYGTDPATFLAAGKLARDNPRKIDADSLFRVYSMTKPITGMAAMMLIEDGKIGLDQNIADFIPGFAHPRVLVDPTKDLTSRPAARPITVRNLLTHTAGLGYAVIVTKGPLLGEYIRLGINPGTISRKPIPGFPPISTAPSLEVFADRLATLPLIADPGTKWSYSVALDLMGRVIEIASGMPFDAFLQKRMFDPLGMRSTFFRVPASETARLTTNYGVSPKGQAPIDPGASSVFSDAPAFPFGGAGLVMSPRDYDRFLLMLAGHGAIGRTRVMKEATARLGMSNLLPPGIDTAGTFAAGQGFGAGGRVKVRPDATPSGIGTYGWGGAAATIAWVDPTKRVRACGFAQYMPDTAIPFTLDFAKSVYASL
ncbi:MAG: beta-lactamase family protein [Sphingomonadaceae bacterium]|nr:beta-lactamase family protein [Sphingomonadaceae bacterium]